MEKQRRILNEKGTYIQISVTNSATYYCANGYGLLYYYSLSDIQTVRTAGRMEKLYVVIFFREAIFVQSIIATT
jgi:hypothetical protein